MIINGGSRRNGRFFANHLSNGEENERVVLCELRNLAAVTIAGALQEMEAVALGTQCRNYFYHAHINPQQGEELTAGQWVQAVDALELNLGLTSNARLVVEHHKKGRTHRHIIWSRISVPAMRAVSMSDDYAIHQLTSRQLEAAFCLKGGISVLGPERAKGARPARRPKAWESFRGKKSGIDPRTMTADLTAAYHGSRDGIGFVNAIGVLGYLLVKTERQFCVVDRAGHLHSLPRRLDGVSAATLIECLACVDPDSLPTVAQARLLQAAA